MMATARDKRPYYDELNHDEIHQQLHRIFSHRLFIRSERMRRFLQFIVEESLMGRSAAVKEYAIGLAVYDKPNSFDPRIDPIIRVEASRLRAKLREYYDEDGRDDPVVISLRKKGYVPILRRRKAAALSRSSAIQGKETAADPELSEAQHLYLKGRHFWNKREPEAIADAIDFFAQAIALAPRYAVAHAGLADCHATQAWLEVEPPAKLWAAAEQAAQSALAVDESLPEATTTLACKQAVYDWTWNASETLFRRAIERAPRYATARHWYAIFCLAPQRRLNAALAEITKAVETDPLSTIIGTHLGTILYFRRQYQNAIEQYRRTLELDPAFHLAYWHMGLAHVQLSQFDEAARDFHQARELGRSAAATAMALGLVYARMKKLDQAAQMLDELQRLSAAAYVSPVSFALIHTALEDRDTAFHWLERARDERASRLVHLKIEPAFDALKTDPRFLLVLSSMNLL